jgi:hypothetical protein
MPYRTFDLSIIKDTIQLSVSAISIFDQTIYMNTQSLAHNKHFIMPCIFPVKKVPCKKVDTAISLF